MRTYSAVRRAAKTVRSIQGSNRNKRLIFCRQSDHFVYLSLKVRSKHPFADVLFYLFRRPEPSAIQFIAGADLSVVHRFVSKYKLPLAGRFKHVSGHLFGHEIGDAQLFLHFAVQSHHYAFTKVHVSAYGGIPFPRLDVFPFGAFLQIQLSFAVEYVQVHHRMEQFAALWHSPRVAALITFPCSSTMGNISSLLSLNILFIRMLLYQFDCDDEIYNGHDCSDGQVKIPAKHLVDNNHNGHDEYE